MPPLPWDEDETILCILSNLENMTRFILAVHVAVCMFEMLEERAETPGIQPKFGESNHFRFIAARDAALNLYHYKCSLAAIKQLLPDCPTLKGHVDPKAIREALKRFKQAFPHTDNVRHAVAHAGELFSDVATMKLNQLRILPAEGGARVFVNDCLMHGLEGRRYTIGLKGRTFTFNVANEALDHLFEIQEAVNQALAFLLREPAPAA